MAIPDSLRRLLEVLRLEEEQARRAAVAAGATRERLHVARADVLRRERQGRLLVAGGVHSGAVGDRLAGLEEICIARRVGAILAPRILAAEREEHQLRQEFLERRTERRQTEILVEAAQRREAREESRRAQQTVDEQHLVRMVCAQRKKAEAERVQLNDDHSDEGRESPVRVRG